MTKPLLADDYIESKLIFPLIAQPKIDGVRALNMTGRFTGRSLKTFKNEYLTKRYSHSSLIGFDGEVAAQDECHPDLCRITSSATGTIKGDPWILWWLFDYIRPETKLLGYAERLEHLRHRIADLLFEAPDIFPHLRLIPSTVVNNLAELNRKDEEYLELGFEGTILRDPNAPHKQGRSGTKPILWRIKRFIDFEFVVDEIIEGEENLNEAQINELGQTFRSSHQENKVKNGMVGAMVGRVLDNVVHEKQLLFEKGQVVRVGAGRMTHAQRKLYFENPELLRQKISKAKFFPKGIKDKPRFPTWQSFRDPVDMS